MTPEVVVSQARLDRPGRCLGVMRSFLSAGGQRRAQPEPGTSDRLEGRAFRRITAIRWTPTPSTCKFCPLEVQERTGDSTACADVYRSWLSFS